MRRRAAEAAAVTAIAVVITIVIAAPVLRAPSERIFGMPTVGHHHDPFTFMQQIDRPIAAGVYLQPATDIPAAFAARAVGPVAAYNWIVLVTFPLSAAAAYLLARHLTIAPLWAALAALAFAFSPFHLSHAAYHPHVAQTQWLPLYLLALWRCVDRPTAGASLALALSVALVALSNFYGGLIAAVLTPVALGAYYWFFASRRSVRPIRRLALTAAVLGAAAAAGLAYVWYAAPGVVLNGAAYGTAQKDLLRYGARWWSYAMPPVEHPAAGAIVRGVWHAAGVNVGLLEQQVSLGWGVIALAGVAIAGWMRTAGRASSSFRVPVLAIVGAAAVVCSLAAGIATLLHPILPMFRAYARFGVMVQLMAVLLAAIGAERLWGSGVRHARAACVTLLVLAVAEYAVWPPSMSRDVMPTAAHRWVAGQPDSVRALDCAPEAGEAAHAQWLTRYRIAGNVEPFTDCAEPNLPDKLAAAGYTHLIVRRNAIARPNAAAGRVPAGLQRAAQFNDSDVYAVGALAPDVHTVSMTGFHPREHDDTWTWRWMEAEASWTIANRTGHDVVASLDVDIMAFAASRELTVWLDGVDTQTLTIEGARGVRHIGPLSLTPGDHQLMFRAGRPAAVPARFASDMDSRPLSFRIGGWRWTTSDRRP